MATTKNLTSNGDVRVTTYWGGVENGLCFDISVRPTKDLEWMATFTKAELIELIRQHKNRTTVNPSVVVADG